MELYPTAILYYDSLLRLDSNHIGSLVNRGLSQRRVLNYNSSLKDLNKVVQLESNVSSNYINRGITFFYNNQFDLALMDFEKCLSMDSTNVDCIYDIGLCYFKLNQLVQACFYWKQACDNNMDDACLCIKEYCR